MELTSFHPPGSQLSATESRHIPIYRTDLTGAERAYVMQCFDDNQISAGRFVAAFEHAFMKMSGSRHAICVSSGTAALHLVLHALGVGVGDEVIVPAFTFIATANAVAMTGATPVFVDCDRATWLVTPDTVRAGLTARTRAVVPAHLYGGVCDLTGLRQFTDDHGLHLVEDCSEAVGASHRGRPVGAWGDAGTFSFFGNKTITTGEGGMITTDDDALGERLRSLRNHAVSADRRYWHLERGFNYKMTDMAAAVGLAQIERLPAILARKREIFGRYHGLLGDCGCIPQRCAPAAESGAWLFSLLLPEGADRSAVIGALRDDGIEVRPVFNCLHQMPAYHLGMALPEAEHIARLGVSLPSFPGLGDDSIDRIGGALAAALPAWLPS